MRLEFGAITAHVELSEEAAWEVLRLANSRAEIMTPPYKKPNGGITFPAETTAGRENGKVESFNDATPHVSNGGIKSARDTNARKIRQIAAKVLVDGEFHERREISAAIREAGLNARNLDSALGKVGAFIRDEKDGRPRYALDPWSLEEANANGGEFTDENLRQEPVRHELVDGQLRGAT